MTGLLIFLIVVAVIVLAGLRGGSTRVLNDERGWWPAYRRDSFER